MQQYAIFMKLKGYRHKKNRKKIHFFRGFCLKHSLKL